MINLQMHPIKIILGMIVTSIMLSLSVHATADIDWSSFKTDRALDQGRNTAKIFGEQLFHGHFMSISGSTFTDNYLIKKGDHIQIRMWGAYQYVATVIVNSNGYIELPNLTPLKLSGVKNAQLNEVVGQAVKQAYRSNVNVYASLEATQPVKVFVTGFVNRPGYYSGLASDTVLAFLDRADGVDAKRGSYIDIQIRRSSTLVQQVNLYDFLLAGQLQSFSFKEGDVIHVSPKRSTFEVEGAVRNDYIFEYSAPDLTVGDALSIANLKAGASHVSIARNPPIKVTGTPSKSNKTKDINATDVNMTGNDTADTSATKLYKLVEAQDIPVHNGDILQVIRAE